MRRAVDVIWEVEGVCRVYEVARRGLQQLSREHGHMMRRDTIRFGTTTAHTRRTWKPASTLLRPCALTHSQILNASSPNSTHPNFFVFMKVITKGVECG